MAKQTSKRLKHRHAFRFIVPGEDGDKDKVFTAWATVTAAIKSVKLVLTAADVRRSMKLKGVGNTQTCSMAVCAKRMADRFPHPVEGYIDWQYSRAYVVSKVSKVTGLPSACVVYLHNDTIAKLNDTRGGQQKLLADLEANGDRAVLLRPARVRGPVTQRKPTGKVDGSRSSRPAAHGAKLRFAFSQLGGVA